MNQYACPKCHNENRLTVLVSVFAYLRQEGENLQTEVANGTHDWDDDSAAMCLACDWAGEVGNCVIP